eukprot:1821063-Rhodomonas_salina.1
MVHGPGKLEETELLSHLAACVQVLPPAVHAYVQAASVIFRRSSANWFDGYLPSTLHPNVMSIVPIPAADRPGRMVC